MSLDYIFGRTDNPHGLYLENKPKFEKSCPEMDKFIEMCFQSGTPMNESKKTEPFKMWLAQVGRERIEETIDVTDMNDNIEARTCR